MSKNKSLLRVIPIITVLFVCVLGIGIVGRQSASGLQSTQKEEIKVEIAEGLQLEILSLKQLSNTVVEVKMKNGYDRDITAIVATAGKHQTFRMDYIYAEAEAHQKLAPGATDLLLYTPTRIRGNLPKVIVTAVVFGDGSSSGDRSGVRDVLGKRLGMKIQLNRINPHLESLGKIKASMLRAKLETIKRIAESLPMEGDGSQMSTGLELGLKHGRTFILNYLSKLETALKENQIQSGSSARAEEEFRSSLPRVQNDFKALAGRL